MKNCPFLIKERQSHFPVEDSRGVSVARNKVTFTNPRHFVITVLSTLSLLSISRRWVITYNTSKTKKPEEIYNFATILSMFAASLALSGIGRLQISVTLEEDIKILLALSFCVVFHNLTSQT